MSASGLYIPGLFVSPYTNKYTTLQSELAPVTLDFCNFRDFYKQGDLDLHAMVKYVAREVKKYDFVIAQCLGFSLYRQAVLDDASCERNAALFLTPPCNYYHSSWLQYLEDNNVEGSIRCGPNLYYKDGCDVSYKLYKQLEDNWHKKSLEFSGNTHCILANQDFFISSNIDYELKQSGIKQITRVNDSHELKNSVHEICSIAKNLVSQTLHTQPVLF